MRALNEVIIPGILIFAHGFDGFMGFERILVFVGAAIYGALGTRVP